MELSKEDYIRELEKHLRAVLRDARDELKISGRLAYLTIPAIIEAEDFLTSATCNPPKTMI